MTQASELDKATLGAIGASIASAMKLAEQGDLKAAEGALERAEKRLSQLAEGRPAHARVVRQARDAISKGRVALTEIQREKRARAGRAALRAIQGFEGASP